MPEPSISVTPIPNTELKKITLKNDELTVVLLNYGARLHQIFAPDNKGHLENVLLSYDELSDVLTDESFFGATVGPVAGRIRNATWGNHQLEKTPATTISTEEQMDGLSNIGMSKCSKIHSRSALSFIYKTLFPIILVLSQQRSRIS